MHQDFYLITFPLQRLISQSTMNWSAQDCHMVTLNSSIEESLLHDGLKNIQASGFFGFIFDAMEAGGIVVLVTLICLCSTKWKKSRAKTTKKTKKTKKTKTSISDATNPSEQKSANSDIEQPLLNNVGAFVPAVGAQSIDCAEKPECCVKYMQLFNREKKNHHWHHTLKTDTTVLQEATELRLCTGYQSVAEDLTCGDIAKLHLDTSCPDLQSLTLCLQSFAQIGEFALPQGLDELVISGSGLHCNNLILLKFHERCTRMSKLTIQYSHLFCCDGASLSFPASLRCLKLSNCGMLGKHWLSLKVCEECPRLEELDLSNNYEFSFHNSDFVQSELQKTFPTSLIYCDVTRTDLTLQCVINMNLFVQCPSLKFFQNDHMRYDPEELEDGEDEDNKVSLNPKEDVKLEAAGQILQWLFYLGMVEIVAVPVFFYMGLNYSHFAALNVNIGLYVLVCIGKVHILHLSKKMVPEETVWRRMKIGSRKTPVPAVLVTFFTSIPGFTETMQLGFATGIAARSWDGVSQCWYALPWRTSMLSFMASTSLPHVLKYLLFFGYAIHVMGFFYNIIEAFGSLKRRYINAQSITTASNICNLLVVSFIFTCESDTPKPVKVMSKQERREHLQMERAKEQACLARFIIKTVLGTFLRLWFKVSLLAIAERTQNQTMIAATRLAVGAGLLHTAQALSQFIPKAEKKKVHGQSLVAWMTDKIKDTMKKCSTSRRRLGWFLCFIEQVGTMMFTMMAWLLLVLVPMMVLMPGWGSVVRLVGIYACPSTFFNFTPRPGCVPPQQQCVCGVDGDGFNA